MNQPSDVLPLAVAAFGRTGTTILMAWLGTDPRVALGRHYPFEDRYLTWLAKFASLTGRHASPGHTPTELEAWPHDGFGPPPWAVAGQDDGVRYMPPPAEWLRALWQAFSSSVRDRTAGTAAYYAEKSPEWVPPVVRHVVPVRTIHLVRDPRDVYLSAVAFVRDTGAIGFGAPGPDAVGQARHIACRMLSFHENARCDRGPGVLHLRYEDLIGRPGVIAARLRRALDVEVSPALPSLGEHERRHRTSPVDAESIERWRREELPEDVRHCLESQLHELLVENDYPRSLSGVRPANVRWNDCRVCSPDGTIEMGDPLTVTVTGPDFGLELPLEDRDAAGTREVWACVRGGSGDHCSVYWRSGSAGYSEDRVTHVPFRAGPHWQIIRFPVAEHRAWEGRLTGLRVDIFNGHVTLGATGEVRWIRLVP